MNIPSFESFSQNGEDVVLSRALRDVGHGRYIDVGASHPTSDSVTWAFYQKGWSGLTIEPNPEFAALQRECRPRDLLVEAAITAKDGDEVQLHVVGDSGLSTLFGHVADTHAAAGFPVRDVQVPTRRLDSVLEEAGWQGQEIHFMSVDIEGSERAALESINLDLWRPWVMVIEATEPNSIVSTRDRWEDLVVDAGYQFCLFDGLSCFYVADEHKSRLASALSYPACVLDNFTTPVVRELAQRAAMIPSLVDDVARWRTEATTRWASVMANLALRSELDAAETRFEDLHRQHRDLQREAGLLHALIGELYTSTSWNATRPLRAVKALIGALRRQP